MNNFERETVNNLLNTEDVTLQEMWSIIQEKNIGCLDAVSSREDIEAYMVDKLERGLDVGHIVAVTEKSDAEYFGFNLNGSNPKAIPVPIITKEDLLSFIE